MIRLFPRSTRGLVLLIAGLLSLATLILGLIVYRVSHEALERQLRHRVLVQTQGLLAARRGGGPSALVAAIGLREAEGRGEGMGYILVGARGERLAGALRASPPEPGWLEHLDFEDGGGARGVAQALTTALPGGGRLVVAADRAPVDAADLALLKVFAAALSITLLLGVGGAGFLGAIIQRRLAQISAAAQAIVDGDLPRRMPRDPASQEFDALAATLNHMLDRMQVLMETLQQVSSDIAHDLRTPLTRLHGVLETALGQPAGDGDQGARLALMRASAHAEEILDLFAALLRIAEIESLEVRAGFQHVDLSGLVERCLDALRPDVEAAGYVLRARIDPGLAVEGDKHLLSQLLVNLIENAARHTPLGTLIVVSLAATASDAVLCVRDNGPGITADKHEVVLRRFSRLEQSRHKPGHGLGLTLAGAVARAHVSTLRLEDARPGLAVSLTLSRA